jgi:hypothetical protein
VVLCRDQLQLVRLAGRLTRKGWTYQVLDKKLVSFEPDTEAPWITTVDNLETVLSGSAIKPQSASVVVSNHFTRYAVVDVDKSLQKETEQIAYVRYRFGQLYGACADTWELRLDQEYPGAPFLASAVEGQLLVALRDMFKRVGVNLQSIQPSLMKAYNQCQPELKNRNAWFVLFEQGMLCIAWLKDGYPSRVRTIKAGDDWLEKLPETLEREAYLSELDGSSRDIMLCSCGQEKQELPKSGPWKFNRIQPAILSGLQDQYDENFALAMCG